MACIIHRKASPKDYIANFFSTIAFLSCYSTNIKSIPDQSLWTLVNYDELDLSPISRKVDKPKMLRRRKVDERSLEKKEIQLYLQLL